MTSQDRDRLRHLHDALGALMARLSEDMPTAPADVSGKGQTGQDFVTSVDLALQAGLETGLTALLPGARVVGEEGFAGMDRTGAPVWLVDPLDGTVNFVAGLPCYAMAVVLIRDGAPVLAAVRDLPRRVTYSAIAGEGAFLDGVPLRPRTHAARLAVLSSGLMRDLADNAPEVLSGLLGSFKLRNLGSQALHLCHAAAGHLALVASREARGWDDMAGALIAREAGLVYGHYGPASPETGAEQMSLCAPAGLFETHAVELARSLPRMAAPQVHKESRNS
ncbi:MAG: inositol monophosphatase family protein [Paracoccaceae bacterium]